MQNNHDLIGDRKTVMFAVSHGAGKVGAPSRGGTNEDAFAGPGDGAAPGSTAFSVHHSLSAQASESSRFARAGLKDLAYAKQTDHLLLDIFLRVVSSIHW